MTEEEKKVEEQPMLTKCEAVALPTPKISLWEKVRNAWDNWGRISITEEMHTQDEWYKEAEAKTMTLKTLPKFLKKLSGKYNHDYGTICHALTASALAAINAMNRTSQGGITGFQAGAVMWRFIREWGMDLKDKPLRLVNYSNMLYPQYDYHFEKTINSNTWKWLQAEAKKNLDGDNMCHHASPNVIAHWQSIVDGKVPFGYAVKED